MAKDNDVSTEAIALVLETLQAQVANLRERPSLGAKLGANNLAHATDLLWLVSYALATGESIGLEAAHGALTNLGGQVLVRKGMLVDLVDTGLRITQGDRAALVRFLSDTLPQFDGGWANVSETELHSALENTNSQARGAGIALALLELNQGFRRQLSSPGRQELTNAASHLRKRRNSD